MVTRAATLPVDEVVLDLEDAVAPDPGAKSRARQEVVRLLESTDFGERTVAVRINAVGGPEALRDLLELIPHVGDRIDCLVIPKVSRTSQIGFVEHCLDALEQDRDHRTGLEIQIEDPAGLEALPALTSCSSRLEALIFGPGDFAAAMGMPHTTIGGQPDGYPGDIWHFPLFTIAVAARARGLQVVDGPYSALSDEPGLDLACRRVAALGLDGKWAIHPSQVDTINRLLAPSAAQVLRAREVLEQVARRGGASRLGEEMVDEATRRMAEAILQRNREELG